MVNLLQQKVRNRLRRQAQSGGGDGSNKTVVDPKRAQWLAIQSRARRISPEEFEKLAAERVDTVGPLLASIAAFGQKKTAASGEGLVNTYKGTGTLWLDMEEAGCFATDI